MEKSVENSLKKKKTCRHGQQNLNTRVVESMLLKIKTIDSYFKSYFYTESKKNWSILWSLFKKSKEASNSLNSVIDICAQTGSVLWLLPHYFSHLDFHNLLRCNLNHFWEHRNEDSTGFSYCLDWTKLGQRGYTRLSWWTSLERTFSKLCGIAHSLRITRFVCKYSKPLSTWYIQLLRSSNWM